jgi:histidyl-tRNA synthetase
MKYADDRKFAFVLIIGIQEKEQQKYALKNMVTGEQIAISWDELIVKFSK